MNVRSFFSFAVFASAFALATAFDAAAHSGNSVDGTLMHLEGDAAPQIGGPPRVYYNVHADDGHIVPVDLSAAQLPPGGIKAAMNKRVRATSAVTVPTGDPYPAPAPRKVWPVQALEVLAPSALIAADQFPLVGTRKYKTLLCQWPEVPSVPSLPVGYFDTQLGAVYPGFDNFFLEVSYGAATIAGSSASASWVTMSHTHAFYNTSLNDGSYLTAIAQDCASAADAAGVDFTGFVGINLMFNSTVDDCCAWGGGTSLTLDGVLRGMSVTWMPYNYPTWGYFGWHEHGVLAHELSHSFGSPHSDDPSGYQYGNEWDVVSAPGGTCAVTDANYGCVGQHPVGDNKLAMGFIAPARIATQASGGATTTYTIERMAQPPNAGGTFQILKVLTPSSHKYYTVESRLRTGYDQNVPGDGVIIMEVVDNRPFISPTNPGDPARLLTPSGSTAAGLGGIDSRWSAGQQYVNATDNVKITVVAFDAATGTATIRAEAATTPGEYSFTTTGVSVIEGGVAVNLAVSRTAPFATAGSVTWTTSNGSAVAGTDFGTAGNPAQKTGTLTWVAGTGGVKNITIGLAASNIPVINNLTQDPARDFGVALSAPVGGLMGAQNTATVTINDSDSIVGFALDTASVNETAGNVVLTVNRTGSTALSQNVTWTTANGTALAGSDFGTAGVATQRTGTLTFPAGSGASQTITIPILADAIIENPETFTVNLTAPTNGAALGTSTSTVTIVSTNSGITMAASTRAFTEGAGPQTITVNRAGPGVGAVSVNFTVNNGTALRGTHFNSVASGTLNWADGDTTPKTIAVDILDDGVVNTTRGFTVALSGAVGATLAAPMSTSVSIADNDTVVQFLAPTTTTTEGLAGGLLTLSLTRTGILTNPATITYTSIDGTALAGTDFGVLGNTAAVTGTVTWLAGVGGVKTITVPILNDSIVEGVKNFRLQLSNPVGTNLSIGANSEVLVTLNDNDAGIRFAQAAYEVTEGTASITLSVQRIGPATLAASATWATVNGTAQSGSDFGVSNTFTPRTGTISWLAGDATAKSITIPIINDTLGGEGDETFQVTLAPGAGLVLGAPGTATVTIHDNDIPPETNVQFSQAKYIVMENGGNAQLTVQRANISGPLSTLTASVNYATVAGTALATSDYLTRTGTLTWASGDFADKTILVPIVDNAVAEPVEAFTVVLSNLSPGTGLGANSTATVSIVDDDEVFPLDGAMPAGFSSPALPVRAWHVSSDAGAFEGVYALKSDEVDDNQSAELDMAGTFAAGSVTFRVKVSSEANFDFLRFYIDGALVQSWSGNAVPGWQTAGPFPVTGAAHTLRWVYEKDGSVSVGLDAAYIDGLVTPAFTP